MGCYKYGKLARKELTTYEKYLPGMSVIAFIEIVMLTFSRMSAGREIEEEELNPMDIDWPRPEVF